MTISESSTPRVLLAVRIVTVGEVAGESVVAGKIFDNRAADSGRLTQAMKEVGRRLGVEGADAGLEAGLDEELRAAKIPERIATPMLPQPKKPRVRPDELLISGNEVISILAFYVSADK